MPGSVPSVPHTYDWVPSFSVLRGRCCNILFDFLLSKHMPGSNIVMIWTQTFGVLSTHQMALLMLCLISNTSVNMPWKSTVLCRLPKNSNLLKVSTFSFEMWPFQHVLPFLDSVFWSVLSKQILIDKNCMLHKTLYFEIRVHCGLAKSS